MKNEPRFPLPVAIIGAGPVGLAAAAHLSRRNVPVRVYEAGPRIAASMRDWGHIRVFTPWRYCVDSAAVAILAEHGWQMPDEDSVPTGAEIVSRYLEPLAETLELADTIELSAEVTAIARHGIDKVVSRDRETRPFVLTIKTPTGERRDLARAVIDASGTWTTPNPLGASGVPAIGEVAQAHRIDHGIPDVLGRSRSLYAGKTVLVVGAGHSAANVLLDLDRLSQDEPETNVIWATRSANLARVFGGGDADELAARADIGLRTRQLVESARIRLVSGFAVHKLRDDAGRLLVDGKIAEEALTLGPIDRVVVSTGQRPDLGLTRELRLDLDPWLESVRQLGPFIDPNEHSCGSVPPHGHRELSHPEKDFFTVGIKSYGRAPTFLLLTGYEQVRSVAAALSGDLAAADAVELTLPETGVCTVQAQPADRAGSCCVAPPAAVPSVAKAAVAAQSSGCGCAT